jgi:endonuclease/exonuclease/phosphatase family metal-dependent hydrolase
VLHGISLRSGMVDLAAAADAVRDLDADIVAVQEVDRDLERSGGEHQAAVLAGRLGWDWAFAPAVLGDPGERWTAAGADDPGGGAYGVGLLSRLPLSDVRRITLPGGASAGARSPGATPQRPGWDHEPRVAVRAVVTVAGTALGVTTTHLSYLPWRGLAQLRAAARAAAAGGGPAVLVGDLNLPVAPVRAALPRRWTHAGGAATYPSWRPRVQLDHLLVTGGVAVRSVAVAGGTTSDHLPLVADLVLPAA